MPFLQSGYQGGASTVVERVLSVPLNLCIVRRPLRPVENTSTGPRIGGALNVQLTLARGELIVITTTTNPALFHDPQSATEKPDSRLKQKLAPQRLEVAVGDNCPQYLRCRVLDLVQGLIGPTSIADGIDGRTTHRIVWLAQQ